MVRARRVAPPIAAALLAAVVAVGAAEPTLLRDINQYPAAPFLPPTALLANGRLFFALSRPDVGNELAIVDTAAGTFQLIDLEPGSEGSSPNGFVRVGTKVVFAATTSAHGTELWVSDGTSAGTVEVVDRIVGLGGSFPHEFAADGAGLAYFAANDGVHGEELWSTDGTVGGTTLFDLQPGGSNGSSPSEITPVPGGVFFSAFAGGFEPWFQGGMPGSRLKDLRVGGGSSFPREFTFLPHILPATVDRTVFSADATGTNRELWITDGTDLGTGQLSEIDPVNSSDPTGMRLVNGELIFRAHTAANGLELWRADGSPGGTALIAESYPGVHAGVVDTDGVTLGTSRYVFPAFFSDTGVEPAVTDGATITRLGDLLPGFGASWIVQDEGTFTSAVATPSKVYVGLDDGVHGWELWQTDGTAPGTSMVVDLLPGLASSQARPLAVDGETLFFLAYGPDGFGVWRYAGGTATLLANLSEPGTADAATFSVVTAADHVWFNALDRDAGDELWRTDGTATGTERVTDMVPGFGGFRPQQLVTTGSRVFFVATDAVHGTELFTSDAVTPNIQLTRDIMPGDTGSAPYDLTPLGDRLLFTATAPDTGLELWISDGTTAGTSILKDIAAGPASGFPFGLVRSGGLVFFKANDGSTDGLFVTDGTPAGTLPLMPTNSVGEMVPFGDGRVLTSLDSIDHGNELWVSNGTPGGTQVFTDLVSGPTGSEPSHLTVADTRVFFTATVAEAGEELWVTEQSASEATAVADLTTGPASTAFFELAGLGPNLVFTADVGDGTALWFSDGTPAGTHRIDGICPSGNACHPRQLFSFDGAVFFLFDDGTHGQELWRTDGTSAGSVMVADSVPGAGSFDYRKQTVAFLGGKIFLAGCDPEHGCEPWIFDYDQCLADPLKLAPGDCGCGVADLDTDASGVSDCLIPDELRARVDGLVALIDPLKPPKGKAERTALKATYQTIRAKMDDLRTYADAHPTEFAAQKKLVKKARKAVVRLTHAGRALKAPRRRALTTLGQLRQAIGS